MMIVREELFLCVVKSSIHVTDFPPIISLHRVTTVQQNILDSSTESVKCIHFRPQIHPVFVVVAWNNSKVVLATNSYNH